MLDGLVGPLSANQPLSIEDGVLGVAGQLVLGGVPNQSLSLGSEGHVARGDSVTLVIGDDLNTAVLEYSHTENRKLKNVHEDYEICLCFITMNKLFLDQFR